MSKRNRKKSDENDSPIKVIVFITAVLNLTKVIFDIIKMLVDNLK